MHGDIHVNHSRSAARSGSSCRNERRWSALDPTAVHPLSPNDEGVEQQGDQVAYNEQSSEEKVIVIDSCDVEIHTTDTKAAVNLQAALQVAIALIISITIGDSDTGDKVTQDLLQRVRVKQSNKQTTYVENSRGVNITTTDTDLAVNIQLLLQVLVALLVKLDIL
ncbi:MAG TPA: spore coat protein [Bacillales bacterium]|nr:spore coat protein [Bacillales bacterium]